MSNGPLQESDGSATTTDPTPATKSTGSSFPLWAKIGIPAAAIVILALGLGLGLGLGLKHHEASNNSTSQLNDTAVADYWESVWSYGGSPAVYPSRTSLGTSRHVPNIS